MKIFSEKLKELRLEEGLSTRELAKRLGVSNMAISRWEREVQIPNIENLVLISNYFKVSPNFLLGYED